MKKKIVIIAFSIMIVLLIGKLYQSYALTTSITESSDSYNIVINNDSSVTVPANSDKIVYFRITNPNNGKLRYGVGYSTGNVRVKVYYDSRDPETGLINYGESKFVKLRLINDYNTSSSVTLSAILGYEYGGDLIVPSGVNLVDTIYYPSSDNLITLVEKKYNVIEKEEVPNNSIIYQYDRTNNLMADVDYNIRYYGASPDNYIYFNCSDYSNQTSSTCEVWRILGVIDNKIKLIRNENIGNYAYDNKLSGVGTSTNNYGSNNWTDARLMIMLNPTDYTSSFSTDIYAYDKGSYYYSLNSTCYAGTDSETKTCDFKSTGLKNDTTRNLISEEIYYLGGHSSSSVYSDVIYEKERSGTNTWNGKVAIAYPSDYGYAADFNYCEQNLYNYNDSTCTGNNWMKAIITNSGNNNGWLLTPYSSYSYSAFNVYSSGNVYSNRTYFSNMVTPVLYLDPLLEIKGGTGSSSNPYQLNVS